MLDKLGCIALFVALTTIARADSLSDTWLERVIPCPKVCEVAAVHAASPDQITLSVPEGAEPKYETIRALLAPFAAAQPSGAAFSVTFALQETLKNVSCPEQAYTISPILENGAFKGLDVRANTPLGLLYGARTLAQMLKPEPGQLPELTLSDWPDMLERGQWGGSSTRDIAWLAARKFNVVEAHATLSCDDSGKGVASLPDAMRTEALREGITLVPIILHLEQILTNEQLRKHLTGLASTPDPSKPIPSDYTPGICFSNPDAIRILGDWMESFARTPEVTDIMLWLSEETAPCFCPACGGREPFAMEVAAAVKAFERAKAAKADIALRLLLTQGSYSVNETVLKAAPPEVKISYYHGSYTYDSSEKPMIYPLLEDFARSGRWLGVYPQVTNAWRTVTPFTGPQFIHARMSEFIDKKLSNVTIYAVPSNDLHDFNVTAAAEWLWNNKGRDETSFARAWARAHGITDPDHFAEWAVAVGPPAWKLAGSRTAITLINDNGVAYMRGDHQFGFGEWILNGIASEEEMASLKQQANHALDLAMTLGYGPAIAESRIHRAYLNLADGLRVLSQAPLQATGDITRYRAAFEEADVASRTLEVEHMAWARLVAPGPFHSRLIDTMASGTRAVVAATKTILKRLQIPDPTPEFRSRVVGAWANSCFTDGISADVTLANPDVWYGAGPYVLTFQYDGGMHGIRIASVDCVAISPEGKETVLDQNGGAADGNKSAGDTNSGGIVNRFEPWREVRFTFPSLPAHALPRLRVHIVLLDDPPPEQRLSRGEIFLRKGYQ